MCNVAYCSENQYSSYSLSFLNTPVPAAGYFLSTKKNQFKDGYY